MSGSMVAQPQAAYSKPAELTNVISHALSAALSFVGLVFLLLKAIANGRNTLGIASVAVFDAALLFTFIANAVYHALPQGNKRATAKNISRSAVAVLILGVYAPVFFITMSGGSSADALCGYILFAALFALTVTTTVLCAAEPEKLKLVRLIAYVIIGGLCIARIDAISVLLDGGFWFLFGGAAMYALGIGLYALKRIPFREIPCGLCIIGGAALHFVCVYSFIL